MPRFVVLTHDHPSLHWDFMLEHGDALRTWRLAQPPYAGAAIAAEALVDHRLAYLDYEGPVSGGRGEVRRFDSGDYDAIEWTAERLRVRLWGERVRGEALLEAPPGGADWTFRLGLPPSGGS